MGGLERSKPFSEKEANLTLNSGKRKERQGQNRNKCPLEDVEYVVPFTKRCIFFHNQNRDNARKYNGSKYPREEKGGDEGDRQADNGFMNRRKNTGNISDKKEHKSTT